MALPIKLQKDEQVVREYKRHPVFLVKQLSLVGAGGIIPVLILNWLVNFLGGFLGDFAYKLAILWILGAPLVALFFWYSYEHDQWLITNQRLVDLNKPNFFKTSVSTADLVNVQDISVEQEGILANMFGFGNVRCQTAGADGGFVIRGVGHPHDALEMVDTARDNARIDLKRA